MAHDTILLTGATGALGGCMIATLLRETDAQILALVRAPSAREGMTRLVNAIRPHADPETIRQRVQPICGDLRKPPWEQDPALRDRLLHQVTQILHLAAATDLIGERARLLEINVGGTAALLELARAIHDRGRLTVFGHFSTAFVAGSRHARHVFETYPIDAPDWSNAYEESKYRAEGLVHEASAEGLPAIVFRPSIVVGDSHTGAISSFGIFYHMVRKVKRSGLRIIPGRPEDHLQIVPIDFVCDAAVAILAQPQAAGRIFHLTSDDPPNIATLLKVGGRTYDWIAALRLVDPAKLGAVAALLPEAERLLPLMGYLSNGLVFDTQNTRDMLRKTGVPMPETGEAFVEKLVRFVKEVEYA